MATPTTTFRLTAKERSTLKRLEAELGAASQTEVVRAGLSLLRRNPAIKQEIRAANAARGFLRRLVLHHGDDAQIEFETGGDDMPAVRIAGEPAHGLVIALRRQSGLVHVDLIDPEAGVGIANAFYTTDDEGRHVVLPLVAIHVPSPADDPDDTHTRSLPDGRTAITKTDPAGRTRSYTLDDEGRSGLLHPEARAILPDADLEPDADHA